MQSNTLSSPKDGVVRRSVELLPLDSGKWQEILRIVRTQHRELYRTWFDNLTAHENGPGVVRITAKSLPERDFLTQKCKQPFTDAVQGVLASLVSVAFHCDNLPTGGVFSDNHTSVPLNPDYAFDHFITGPCNRLAHAAAVAVSDQPGKTYNPLFIHGGVGLGKTHLLQATCQRLLERNPSWQIMYMSCDSFINQFMNSIEAGKMNEFRYRYRQADVLVIDDIHFLGGRERSQEEFFHTFNTLYQQHKQIILSADCPPSEIPSLEDRLVSRFNSGLVARIEKPCYETRVAILRRKSRMRSLEIPEDVVCYIAAKIENNTRELEGAINKLQGMAMIQNGVIDLELAKAALGENDPQEQRRITIQQILDAVTRYYNVRLSDLQSKKRNKSIAFPRQVCMYLVRQHTRYSLEEIGGYFGGRDHTTVLHAVRTIDAHMQRDREIAKQMNLLNQQLVG